MTDFIEIQKLTELFSIQKKADDSDTEDENASETTADTCISNENVKGIQLNIYRVHPHLHFLRLILFSLLYYLFCATIAFCVVIRVWTIEVYEYKVPFTLFAGL